MLSRLRLNILAFLSNPKVVNELKQNVEQNRDALAQSFDPVIDAVSNIVALGARNPETVQPEMYVHATNDLLVAMAWQNPSFDLDKLATQVMSMLDMPDHLNEFVDGTLTWDTDAHASLTEVGSTPFLDNSTHALLSLVVLLVGYSLTV